MLGPASRIAALAPLVSRAAPRSSWRSSQSALPKANLPLANLPLARLPSANLPSARLPSRRSLATSGRSRSEHVLSKPPPTSSSPPASAPSPSSPSPSSPSSPSSPPSPSGASPAPPSAAAAAASTHAAHIDPASVDVEEVETITGRKRIVAKELSRGAFWELKELRGNGGKIFPGHVLPQPLQVGELEGCIRLDSGERTDLRAFLPREGPFVLNVSFNQFGFDMLKSWREGPGGFDENPLPPDVQVVTLSISQGGILSLFKSLLIPGVRKIVPPALHASTLLHYGDTEVWRTALNIDNKLTSYVLAGKKGRVTFAACGGRSDEDDEELRRACEELRGGGGGGGAGGGARGARTAGQRNKN